MVWSLRSQYQLATVRLDEPGRRAAAVPRWPRWPARRARSAWPSSPGTPRRPGSPAGQVPVTEGIFARDGAMWTLAYGGVTVRMRDAKGLSDLAVLLAVARP